MKTLITIIVLFGIILCFNSYAEETYKITTTVSESVVDRITEKLGYQEQIWVESELVFNPETRLAFFKKWREETIKETNLSIRTDEYKDVAILNAQIQAETDTENVTVE